MYSVRLSTITNQMRNCVTTTRGDWLFNNSIERDQWLKENHGISTWSGGDYDEIVFKSENDYLMFMLRWS